MNDGPDTSANATAPETGMGNLFGQARNPADYPLPPGPAFDCPTGTCDNKPCSSIARNQKYTIDPFLAPHINRNQCNRCPTNHPFELTIERRMLLPNVVVLTDAEGNIWNMDSAFTAPIFHGDPGLGRRDAGTATYRVAKTANDRAGGWQCRYYGGVLDDTSYDLGTYDYADAPGILRAVGRFAAGSYVDNLHDDMDVAPHAANPAYAPGLTEKF
ncbi:MAG: hypothetical protein RLZZ437_3370 [Pseudomonadota bacterium]|jgi:hypothetical protein